MSNKKLVVVRGGGDMATGTIQKLHRAGFAVLILETAKPAAIRRKVALCEAVYDGQSQVEDITCLRCSNWQEAQRVLAKDQVALLIDPEAKCVTDLKPWAVVDAILAKRNLGTTRSMAPKTIALGPGFAAGQDVDIVVETMRGHDLGRLVLTGSALPNTGVPGLIAGVGKERVVHAEAAGVFQAIHKIGDTVSKGDTIAFITTSTGKVAVTASLTGVLRGILRDNFAVTKGFKLADIDPRQLDTAKCVRISDKSRCVGGAVLEGLLYLEKIQGY